MLSQKILNSRQVFEIRVPCPQQRFEFPGRSIDNAIGKRQLEFQTVNGRLDCQQFVQVDYPA
jgi:hypothetical protein